MVDSQPVARQRNHALDVALLVVARILEYDSVALVNIPHAIRNLVDEQAVLVFNKIAYRMGDIHQGDVVVFQYPRDHEQSYIKRVIALPGNRLRIDHGLVYVNGNRLPEPYVPSRFADDRSQPEMVLPPHEYFVMGDHRSISSDSREFGPVERSLIYGKAVFVYWPMEQVGVVR